MRIDKAMIEIKAWAESSMVLKFVLLRFMCIRTLIDIFYVRTLVTKNHRVGIIVVVVVVVVVML